MPRLFPILAGLALFHSAVARAQTAETQSSQAAEGLHKVYTNADLANAKARISIIGRSAPPASAQAPAAPADPLAEMLAGRTSCRAGDVKALVSRLDELPGTASRVDAEKAVDGLFESWCGKKAGALYFQARGLLSGRIRDDMYAVWVERANGTAVKNAELPKYLAELAGQAYAAGRTDPSGAPVMTRRFTLFTDVPGQWRTAFRDGAHPDGAPAELIVNQGDTVALRLVNGIYSTNTPAGFVLEGYNVRYDVFPTDSQGVAVPPFVADRPGTFHFFELRAFNRVPGTLIVRPR